MKGNISELSGFTFAPHEQNGTERVFPSQTNDWGRAIIGSAQAIKGQEALRGVL